MYIRSVHDGESLDLIFSHARKRTLSLSTKLAILFSLATAIVTIALVIGEVAIHPIFGHHQ